MTGRWRLAATRWRSAKRLLTEAEAALAEVREQFERDNAPLLEDITAAHKLLNESRDALIAEGAGKAMGVSVNITQRRGVVDWKSAAAAAYRPADHGPSFDAWSDEHRKPGSTVATVKEV